MSWFSRLTHAVRPSQLDRDLADEAAFHREEAAADLRRQGVDAGLAARESTRRFGDDWRLREDSREVKASTRIESLWRDVRFGGRMLAKNPAVSAAAVLSLGLAIGACATAFSLIDALILRPLPVHDPQGLVYITYPPARTGEPDNDYFSYKALVRLRESAGGKIDLFTAGNPVLNDVILDGVSQRIRSEYVSGNIFQVLGLQPHLGRLLSPADDRNPAESPVAVISYDFWVRLGSDPAILGKSLTARGARLSIVGVAPRGFTGVEPGLKNDVWVPNMMINPQAFKDAGWEWFRILGRLQPGVTPEQAEQALQASFNDFRRSLNPDAKFKELLLHASSAANGPSRVRRMFARPLWIVAIVAGLVLLIAGSNVANLLVARSAARQREMAVRISMGAGRGRLVQQMLLESGLLACAACALGLALAYAMAPAVVGRLMPTGEPAYLDLHVSWRVVAFLAALGTAAAAGFGLIPAIRASAVAPQDVLKSGAGQSSARQGLLRPLVAAQVAFSFVVLFTGGLLLLSFHRLSTIDLGLARTGVALFELDGMGDRGNQSAMQLLDRVRQVPGVRAAGYSSWALLNSNRWTSEIAVPGRTSTIAHMLSTSPGFFDAMGIGLLSGRDFTPTDMTPDSPSAIVNEAFAAQNFPGENAVGKQVTRVGKTLTIVGLVRNSKYRDLRAAAPSTVYLPLTGKGGMTLEVRTAGDPTPIVASLREAIQSADRTVRVSRVTMQSELVSNQMIADRLLALLSGFFAIVAVTLVGIGLYGVLSYSVLRRTKEMGIRMALGARATHVIRLLVTETGAIVCAGVVAGLAGSLALARYVATLLFEVRPGDTATLLLPLSLLLLASMLAALAPALRAAKLDPMSALRQD